MVGKESTTKDTKDTKGRKGIKNQIFYLGCDITTKIENFQP